MPKKHAAPTPLCVVDLNTGIHCLHDIIKCAPSLKVFKNKVRDHILASNLTTF